MRALVCYGSGNAKLKGLADSIVKGLKRQGHSVELMEMGSNSRPISMGIYDFFIVGTTSMGFWGGKIPEEATMFINKVSRLEGKKAAAFMPAGGLGVTKSLMVLMKAIEKQGAIVLDSAVMGSEKEAEDFAYKIKLG